MKRLLIHFCIMFVTSSVAAMPEYTSRENALYLAKVIDKGLFQHKRIASTFVKNKQSHQYYLQVILDDGSSHEWKINRIYEWSLNDTLLLSKNRVLIFPDSESADFQILDKKQFYKRALAAYAFQKNYSDHDLLTGQSLKFAIRKFGIIQPSVEGFYQTDEQGHRYRYTFDFKNGIREVLTYLDAYQLLENGLLLDTVTSPDWILERPFQAVGLSVFPETLEDDLRGIWRFAVGIEFQQNISLKPEHIPFQVVEESERIPQTGERQTKFFVQVMIPNTQIAHEPEQIRSLEYLRNIQLVADTAHQKRIFLRAELNPEIFELRPHIEIQDQLVVVNFFSVIDQSVIRKPEATREQPLFQFKTQTPFEKLYLQAVEEIRTAQRSPVLGFKIERYIAALENLKRAAMNASDDTEIVQALEQRDQLYQILPKMILQNTTEQLRRADKQFSREVLLKHIQVAEDITINSQILKEFAKLKKAMK